VLYLWSIAGGADRVSRWASLLAALGLVAQGVAIALDCAHAHRVAIINLAESLMFISWTLTGLYLLMERRFRMPALGAFATLVSACLIVVASSLPGSINAALLPALQSHWNAVHTITCLLGYSGFTLAFGSAVVYAIQARMLKTKRINVIQRRLPSLDVADRFAYKMVSIGFPMLTLGIITGSLWAQTAWNSYWNWDPKETWSLITWLIYAAYLHVRIVSRRRDKWANRLLIIGFLCVLITFIGVNLLGSGLHIYSW
jgi:cytochrome c-type biogenesis protein CcsB